MAKRVDISGDDYLKGLNDIIESLQEEIDKLQTQSVKGLETALLYVAKESQKKAPVEFGDLRGSVLVEMDNTVIAEGNEGGGLTVTGETPENAVSGSVSYNTPYAANQHEHTEYDHPLGGQAKYLESVLTGDQDKILDIIAGKKEVI